MKKLLIALITCVLAGFLTVAVTLNVTEVHADGEYKIVGTAPDGDAIISNITVKDFGAKGDGKADDTQAFSDALSAAGAQGGGIVYVPSGKYRLTKPVSVPTLVSLCGEWKAPTGKYDGQTVLVADYDGNGSTLSSNYFITLMSNAEVCNLCIYYARQDVSSPREYPYAVGTKSAFASVRNLTLINAYNGVLVTTASHAENLYITAFNIGFKNTSNYEISEFVNINVSGKYLSLYEKTNDKKLKTACSGAKAVVTGKSDDLFMYEINIDPDYYKNAIYVELENSIPVAPKQAYGHIFQAHGAEIIETDKDYYMKVSYEDKIAGVTAYRHEVSKDRSVGGSLFVIEGYASLKNGGDATSAVKKAVSEAERSGGGIVFIPAGRYRITDKISVPANVEIRGAHNGYIPQSGTTFVIAYGKGNADDCVFDVKGGIRGVTIYAEDMSYESQAALEASVYPWMIRLGGNGAWAVGVTFTRCYNGVRAYGAENFLIKGIWGTCINKNVEIGGGSKNGVVEYVMCTYGTWWEYSARDEVATENLLPYSYANTVGLTLGDVKDLAVLSLSAFGIKTSLKTESENGKSAENVRVIRLVADLPYGENNVEIHAGNNIALIGLSTGGGVTGSRFVKLYNSFDGKMRVYGHVVWANSTGTVIYSDNDYAEYSAKSEDVDIIKFDFPWENSSAPKKKGCKGGISAEVVPALALCVAGLVLTGTKKRRK